MSARVAAAGRLVGLALAGVCLRVCLRVCVVCSFRGLFACVLSWVEIFDDCCAVVVLDFGALGALGVQFVAESPGLLH